MLLCRESNSRVVGGARGVAQRRGRSFAATTRAPRGAGCGAARACLALRLNHSALTLARSSESRCTCASTRRQRRAISLILEMALFSGSEARSSIRSTSSLSMSSCMPVCCHGWSQKEPMYTRAASGLATTPPSDHIMAPYTWSRPFGGIESALLSTTRTLPACSRRSCTTCRNSSPMSVLCASKRSSTRSECCANHLITAS